MTRTILGAIVITALALALGFVLVGEWIVALLCVLAGALWVLGELRGNRSVPVVGLLACVAGTAYGAFDGVLLPLVLIALVAALVAWDGGRFVRRMQDAPQVVFADELMQAHQRRMFFVAGIGLLVGALALVVRVPISFTWILLLSVLAIIGLTRALRFFQRESE